MEKRLRGIQFFREVVRKVIRNNRRHKLASNPMGVGERGEQVSDLVSGPMSPSASTKTPRSAALPI